MGDIDEFIENVKTSFTKVKAHMQKIEEETEKNRNYLIEQKKELEALKERIELILNEFKEKKDKKDDSIGSSSGNEGVYANNHSVTHSFKQTLMHIPKQIDSQNTQNMPKITDLKNEIKDLFSTLTNKEFLVFLTIYQLEEELGNKVSYLDISRYLKLSEGCIRSHISIILKKRIPLQKYKLNNKLSLFTIDPEFRALNLKKELMEFYFNVDSKQRTLDRF